MQDTSRIVELLDQARIMQLATNDGGKPWICSVYFVYDDDLNLYWLSYPDRRHSQELAKNPWAAVTMPIKADLPVISLSAEGVVSTVKDSETMKRVTQRYAEKYGEGQGFYERFLAGTNKHMLYCLRPENYFVFDEVHYVGAKTRQTFTL